MLRRIPEGRLLFWEWAGGALVGMIVRRLLNHKTRQLWFDVATVLLLMLHLAFWVVWRRTLLISEADVAPEVRAFFGLTLMMFAFTGLTLCRNKSRFASMFTVLKYPLGCLLMLFIAGWATSISPQYFYGEIPKRKLTPIESLVTPESTQTDEERWEQWRRRYVLGEE